VEDDKDDEDEEEEEKCLMRIQQQSVETPRDERER